MKKILLMLLMAYSSLNCLAAPNEKVLTSFIRSFPEAKNVIWGEDASLDVVYFSRGAEQCRLWYTKEGEVQKSIRYYPKELLHPFIRARVEAKYKDKSISGITEVNSAAGVEYNITLEDSDKLYFVKSDATGNLVMDKKMTKR
jgi:hypothetical protein